MVVQILGQENQESRPDTEANVYGLLLLSRRGHLKAGRSPSLTLHRERPRRGAATDTTRRRQSRQEAGGHRTGGRRPGPRSRGGELR